MENNEITAFLHNNRAIVLISKCLAWKQRFTTQYNGGAKAIMYSDLLKKT